MKILACHNFYRMPGGEDRVFADETKLLRSNGHEVIQFSVHNDDINEHRGRLRLAWETVWNRKIANQIGNLVRQHEIDVVHFHNTMPQISPAGYYAARNAGAAVVQTLHNYRLLCPNAVFFRDGKVCEDCKCKLLPLPAVKHKCYRNNRGASAVVAGTLFAHRLLGTYRRAVDAYIALSEFGRSRFIEGGLPSQKIHIKPNFNYEDPGFAPGDGNFALFLGRLSFEKGIKVLLSAWEIIGERIPLTIVGKGPEEELVHKAVAKNPAIKWFTWVDKIEPYLAKAKFLVMPSENYEGFPRVLVESLSSGTPILTSRLGSMAEIVQDGETGYVFESGNPADLAEKALAMYAGEERLQLMRQKARKEFLEKYTPETNIKILEQIYRSALSRASSRKRRTHPGWLYSEPALSPTMG